MSRFKFLGINDDKSHCECCGKQGLKRVVWIEDCETNEIRHFGTTCAMAPAKGFTLDLEIKAEMRRLDEVQKSRFAPGVPSVPAKGWALCGQPGQARILHVCRSRSLEGLPSGGIGDNHDQH